MITRTNVFTELQFNELQSNIQAAEIQEAQNISVPKVLVAIEKELTDVDFPNNDQVQASPLPSLQSDKRQLIEYQEKLNKRIMNHLKTCEERIRLLLIKFMPKKLLADMNAATENIESRTLQETSQLMYSAALIATEALMPERIRKKGRMPAVPKWKISPQNKIGTLRSAASKLKEMKEKKVNNNKTKGYLIKKYHLDKRKIKEALEIVKQQMIAVSRMIQRYEDKIKQFQ
ncbi:hypothetical protein JRQ81_000757 [Phrynocephalus forsythii]|uniref:Uncharacterized protein n=1 Tax=Phrynocephalus forsythii TaxID=171643 RepID=A0A9Q1B7P4_9SAUR|nr:hypothetical protein JRQ81_000757 [Phrynocephalus forsythii]